MIALVDVMDEVLKPTGVPQDVPVVNVADELHAELFPLQMVITWNS